MTRVTARGAARAEAIGGKQHDGSTAKLSALIAMPSEQKPLRRVALAIRDVPRTPGSAIGERTYCPRCYATRLRTG